MAYGDPPNGTSGWINQNGQTGMFGYTMMGSPIKTYDVRNIWDVQPISLDVTGELKSKTTDDLKAKIDQLEALFFRKVVSKCPACGQWGAAMCECKHCGYPIGLGEMPK